MQHLTLISATAAVTDEYGFNSRDLIALTCWMQQSEAHGYRRVLIESGTANGSPEDGGYVLIYAPACDWASWGVARSGEDLVVWHCGTGADLGRFPTMLAALDSLPPVKAAGPTAPLWSRSPPMQPSAVQPRLSVVHSA